MSEETLTENETCQVQANAELVSNSTNKAHLAIESSDLRTPEQAQTETDELTEAAHRIENMKLDDDNNNDNQSNDHSANFKKLDVSPATLEALKTLSAIGMQEGVNRLTNCDKLTASLEQLRSKKNMHFFDKLNRIKQDFSELNCKIAQMEESIIDLRQVTSNLVKSLPPDVDESSVKY